jgi:hypothetical protein
MNIKLRVLSKSISRTTIIFVLYNTTLVWPVILLTFSFKQDTMAMCFFAFIIVIIQSKYYFNSNSRKSRLLVFYIGFLAFCWSMTLIDLLTRYSELTTIESFVGLFMRGIMFVLFGHLLGFVLLVPIIFLLNRWAERVGIYGNDLDKCLKA